MSPHPLGLINVLHRGGFEGGAGAAINVVVFRPPLYTLRCSTRTVAGKNN